MSTKITPSASSTMTDNNNESSAFGTLCCVDDVQSNNVQILIRRHVTSRSSSSSSQRRRYTLLVAFISLFSLFQQYVNAASTTKKQVKAGLRTNQQQQQQHQRVRRLQELSTITTGSDHGVVSVDSRTQSNDSNTVETKSQRKNVIVDYLNSMVGGQNNIVVLKWTPNGILQRYNPVRNRMWFRKESQIGTYKHTQPSQYGTVALLLNTDILQWLDWNVVPPVPVLVYTMPDKFVNDTHYHLLPDPYDLYGFNEFCVWRLQQLVGAELTYEQYMERKNVIVWRGEHHDDMDIVRKTIIEMSRKLEDDIVQNPSTPAWLDVADIKINPTKKIEMEELVHNYRYQIDIGGVSGTSWGGTRWKMCTGSFTFKVDTFSKDWWHYDLVAWEHYVPVKADLSDLYDLYQWVEQNPRRAYEISQAGMKKCLASLPKAISQQRVIDVIAKLPPAPSQDIIDDAEDIYVNHLHYFVSPSNDTDYNGGYTGN